MKLSEEVEKTLASFNFANESWMYDADRYRASGLSNMVTEYVHCHFENLKKIFTVDEAVVIIFFASEKMISPTWQKSIENYLCLKCKELGLDKLFRGLSLSKALI